MNYFYNLCSIAYFCFFYENFLNWMSWNLRFLVFLAKPGINHFQLTRFFAQKENLAFFMNLKYCLTFNNFSHFNHIHCQSRLIELRQYHLLLFSMLILNFVALICAIMYWIHFIFFLSLFNIFCPSVFLILLTLIFHF